MERAEVLSMLRKQRKTESVAPPSPGVNLTELLSPPKQSDLTSVKKHRRSIWVHFVIDDFLGSLDATAHVNEMAPVVAEPTAAHVSILHRPQSNSGR